MSVEDIELGDLPVDTNYETQGVPVKAFLAGLESTRSRQALQVPTDDEEVRARLRLLNEPVTFFGEGPAERRERLIALVEIGVDAGVDVDALEALDPEEEEEEEEEFYTPGIPELLRVRKHIATLSMLRAQQRLNEERERATKTSITKQLTARRRANLCYSNGAMELVGSNILSTRPVSIVRINALDTSRIVVGSWCGSVSVVDSSTLEPVRVYQDAHQDKVGGAAWSPVDASKFVTGGGTDVKIWSTSSETGISELRGHAARVVRTAFHPSGLYIGSASFDKTWRLWDVEAEKQLLLQEGHSKEVYALGFHCDGSLVASAGLDAIGLVWDIRTGKNVMILQGHIGAIYGIDWRNNGHQLATGSADGSVKVWDLRMTKELYSIPAHNKIVSDVKFYNDMLVTCSYDRTVKIWSCDNWIQLNKLEGHSDKVMSVDLSDDYMVSGGWDRSLKLWKNV